MGEWLQCDNGVTRQPADPPHTGLGLMGIGGPTGFVLLTTVIEFTRDDGGRDDGGRDDGGPARVRGQYAAFTDPRASDLSVLGRDLLDHFDVILSRRRGEVLPLAPSHAYFVSRG